MAFVLISGSLFGLAHWEQGLVAMIAVSIMGLFGGVLYLLCNSLWPLVIAHVVTNLAVHAVRSPF
jgi:uncharacterized protein